MDKSNYCPSKKLIDHIYGVVNFEELNKEPFIEKKGEIFIENTSLDEFLIDIGINPDKMKVENYQKNQELLSELYFYGDDKETISTSLKNHVKECHKCSRRYLFHLIREAQEKFILQDYRFVDEQGKILEPLKKQERKSLVGLLLEKDNSLLKLLNP